MSVKRLVPLNNYVSDTLPTVARNGDMYLDTISGRLLIYFNDTWRALVYVLDVDPALFAVIDGGQYNTPSYDQVVDNEFASTVQFTSTIDSGTLVA